MNLAVFSLGFVVFGPWFLHVFHGLISFDAFSLGSWFCQWFFARVAGFLLPWGVLVRFGWFWSVIFARISWPYFLEAFSLGSWFCQWFSHVLQGSYCLEAFSLGFVGFGQWLSWLMVHCIIAFRRYDLWFFWSVVLATEGVLLPCDVFVRFKCSFGQWLSHVFHGERECNHFNALGSFRYGFVLFCQWFSHVFRGVIALRHFL